jgi:tetratricopeptide (TPR) repeat protein
MVSGGEMPDESKESEHRDESSTNADDSSSSDVSVPASVEPPASAETLDGADLAEVSSEYEIADEDATFTEASRSRPPPRMPPPLRVPPRMPPAPPPRMKPPVLVNTGASQLPPAPAATTDAISEAVARLRAEVAATSDKPRRARLLHEAAEIQERAGDESGAARDYLGSYNCDTTFREPLEGLVRLLERRRSLSNIGKLIEALVTTASTPEERARALTARAIFAEDVQKDLEGARGVAREATETGASAGDLGPAWLALEMVAAKLGDTALREEALAGRADLTKDPTWHGLLLVDVAKLAAASGEIERALGLLAHARARGGSAAFDAAIVAERIVRADAGLSGTDDVGARQAALADALESRADMIERALADVDAGDAAGVPHHVRTLADVVDVLMMAAEARRLAGDLDRAALVLDRALDLLRAAAAPEEDAPTRAGDFGHGSITTMERLVLGARLRIAEHAGDTKRAAELAERRAVGETDGGVAASLAMRVAEHAASQGDIPNALVALSRATDRDPTSAPARALKLDMLGGGDPTQLATELEDLASQFTTGEARGRALVLAAYIWASRTENTERARAALGRASAAGVPKETIARLGRTLASLRADLAWFEAATQELVDRAPEGAASTSELPFLWIELARLRLARGDEAGAAAATAALRALPEGAWLGRVLDGLASPDAEPERARVAVEELAASTEEPSLRRSLRVVCALRARAAGDDAKTREHLEELAKEDASDPLVTAYLGDLLRLAGDRAGAARLARAAAESIDAQGIDPVRAAARHLEAGFETWALGDREDALASFHAAEAGAPEAAQLAVRWATRALQVDSVEGRRRALDAAGDDASIALERFALEATMGDPDEAASALSIARASSSESIRLAAALARLAWPRTGAFEAHEALDALGLVSDTTRTAAAAERLRLFRETAGTGATETAEAARAWLDAGGGMAAATEWLASAMAEGDPQKELPARQALANLTSDESRESLNAGRALLAWALDPDAAHELVAGSSHAVRLANLELSPPGCDPRRRASTLSELDGALGDEAENDALGLAAWSAYATGDLATALDMFRTVANARPDELHAWEGLRTCAEALGDHEAQAGACEQLGARCQDPARGAAFWEESALAWLKVGPTFASRVDAALEASFARDRTRPVAFDRLFRLVRERKDHDKLLDLIDRRLEVIDDAKEIAKLYWEQARALREKGDPDGALEALDHVTTFDEDHVGALALTGEIFIRRGMFAEAAEKLARLARVEAAPAKNRVTAGVAAVDLYENKLGRYDLALEVLVGLHRAELSTLPVRERLARAAARTGSWSEATAILEELMFQRPETAGRIEAARLAMAIHRERKGTPAAAVPAARKLLDEAPGDGEALDFILTLPPTLDGRQALLERGRDAILMSVHENPSRVDEHRLLGRIAGALGDSVLEQAALSCAIAIGGPDPDRQRALTALASRKPRSPQVALGDSFRHVVASGDDGPIAELFVALGPTLAEALGPTREGVQVGKKDRIDPKAGTALRAEIALWAGAFGIGNFDLYVGGKDPVGVLGIAGETPAIVIGPGVNAPLDNLTRARLARELAGIVRGTTMLRSRDDATAAAVVVAACNLAKIRIQAPPLAGLAEVERSLGKAISRKVRGVIEPLCRAYATSGQDAFRWAQRARMTQARFATVASGDVSIVLAELAIDPTARLGSPAAEEQRAHELIRFILSRPYFDVRRALGLEGQR